MRVLTLTISLLCVFSASPVRADAPVGFAEAWAAAKETYEEELKNFDSIGSSLYVMKDGDVLGAAYYGLADKATSRAVDENTIYHWASVTKVFTGIAVMQLRDRGLISLEDRVVDYLPELKSVHNPYGDMEDITIWHLLTHSSGFRQGTWPWGGDKDWHPHEPSEWYQLVAMLPYTEISFEPGSKFSYSNPAIVFLSRILEIVTGDNYEVYMHKNVLLPLGMTRSYFDQTPWHLRADRANNYFIEEDGTLTENGLEFDTGITVSNGGLNAPMPDMAKFLNFLVGVKDNGNYDHVLSRETLEEMWQPAVQINMMGEEDVTKLAEAEQLVAMGYTFFVSDRLTSDKKSRDRIIGHTGGQKAYRTFIYVNPETSAATAFAVNTVKKGQPETNPLRRVENEVLKNLFPILADD